MKRKKVVLSFLILCILALSGGLFWFFKLRISPKQKIIKALTDTCSSLTLVTGTSSDQFIGMDKINTILKEQSAQVSGDFTIDFINKMTGYQVFEGFSLGFDGKKDLSSHEASFELCFGKEKPLRISSYLNEEALVFSAPELMENNYHIDFSSIGEYFKDSSLMAELGMQDFSLQPFSKPQRSPFSKVFSSFLKNKKEDWKALFSNITFKKTDTKKSIRTLDGVEKCVVYEVTIPKESITEFIASFKNYLSSNTATDLDLTEEAYESLRETVKNIESISEEHLTKDFTFSLSLDRNGVLREFSTSYDKFSFCTTFYGIKRNTDAILTECKLDHKTHPLTLTYEESVTASKDEDTYETKLSLFLSKEPEKKIDLTTKQSFSKESLEFSNSSKLVVPTIGINAEFSYEGVFTDFVKNQSFSADINELELKVFGLRIFSLNGEITVSPLREPVTPRENGVDLFTLTNRNWEELLETLKDTIKNVK